MTQLERDLERLVDRRAALGGIVSVSALALAGCQRRSGGGGPPPGEMASMRSYPEVTARAAGGATCVAFPGETEGPFPADGRGRGSVTSVLGGQALQRTDIRSSFAGMNGTAEGVVLDIELTLVDVDSACAPMPGRAVYVWHCDAAGNYSLYSLPEQNYLRGLQVTDAAGKLRFRTIFPAAYRGRFPHIHFEVFETAARATGGSEARLTSQLALPAEVARSVYASPLYRGSLDNLADMPLERDMVFADNSPAQVAAQMMRVTPSGGGLHAAATVGLTNTYGAKAGA